MNLVIVCSIFPVKTGRKFLNTCANKMVRFPVPSIVTFLLARNVLAKEFTSSGIPNKPMVLSNVPDP